MKLYSNYLEYLRERGLLKSTLVRQLQPWSCQAVCHLFENNCFSDILEIGRSAGHSYGLLRWLSPYARIVSIDPVPTEAATQVANMMGGEYKFINKRSALAFEAGDVTGRFDFVLIDGNHTYEGAAADWASVRDMLKPEAVVMFDNLDHGQGCGRVFEQIEETATITKVHLCPPAVWPKGAKGTAGFVFFGNNF